MTKDKPPSNVPPEIYAMGVVYEALKPLDPSVQMRVLRYCAEMFGLSFETSPLISRESDERAELPPAPATPRPAEKSDDDLEGINAVALKWMKRSQLDPRSLRKLFSLGIDEIDLVANAVPGKNKKERMRSVFLLKGIGAYLGSGVARITYEQAKEACLHYDAYDAGNFAAKLKSLAAEVAGTKEAGFTLTPRGLTAGTELVKEMVAAQS